MAAQKTLDLGWNVHQIWGHDERLICGFLCFSVNEYSAEYKDEGW